MKEIHKHIQMSDPSIKQAILDVIITDDDKLLRKQLPHVSNIDFILYESDCEHSSVHHKFDNYTPLMVAVKLTPTYHNYIVDTT